MDIYSASNSRSLAANGPRVYRLQIPRPQNSRNPQSSTLSPEPVVHQHSYSHHVHAARHSCNAIPVLITFMGSTLSLGTLQLPVLAPQTLNDTLPSPQTLKQHEVQRYSTLRYLKNAKCWGSRQAAHRGPSKFTHHLLDVFKSREDELGGAGGLSMASTAPAQPQLATAAERVATASLCAQVHYKTRSLFRRPLSNMKCGYNDLRLLENAKISK